MVPSGRRLRRPRTSTSITESNYFFPFPRGALLRGGSGRPTGPEEQRRPAGCVTCSLGLSQRPRPIPEAILPSWGAAGRGKEVPPGTGPEVEVKRPEPAPVKHWSIRRSSALDRYVSRSAAARVSIIAPRHRSPRPRLTGNGMFRIERGQGMARPDQPHRIERAASTTSARQLPWCPRRRCRLRRSSGCCSRLAG
jgi:hypothetical protein